MIARVWPGALAGSVPAIASKSAAHRLLLLAALADGPTFIFPEARSQDIEATLGCLGALGASWAAQPRGIQVAPATCAPGGEADCGESGSTLRFLIPIVAALGAKTHFTGRGRLPERPLGPLIEELSKKGCAFDAQALPFTVSGRLSGGEFQLPGDVSSQFVTGLLLALPLIGGGRIRIIGRLESKGYVQMTIDAMARFGAAVRAKGALYDVPSARYLSPGAVRAEGDWSNAAFFLAAGAQVTGLDADSAQPDRAILRLLSAFEKPDRTINVQDTPDLLPILAAVAAVTPGTTAFTGAARLRIKESDRLEAMAQGILHLGGDARALADGLIVECRGPLAGGEVDACGDHRIAMALSIAATRCRGPVAIHGAEAVDKSYPGFFEDFKRLGGRMDVL